jgi:hypothetical protein
MECSRASVSTDSGSAVSVIHGLLWAEKKCLIKEINGSEVSERVPSKNGP